MQATGNFKIKCSSPVFLSQKAIFPTFFGIPSSKKKNICNLICMTQFCFYNKWSRLILLQLTLFCFIVFDPVTHLKESSISAQSHPIFFS